MSDSSINSIYNNNNNLFIFLDSNECIHTNKKLSTNYYNLSDFIEDFIFNPQKEPSYCLEPSLAKIIVIGDRGLNNNYDVRLHEIAQCVSSIYKENFTNPNDINSLKLESKFLWFPYCQKYGVDYYLIQYGYNVP